MTTFEVVNEYYRAVNAGDWERWLTFFADDVVGDEQLAGHFAGINVLRGAIDGIKQGYKTFQMHPRQVIVDGDRCCVVWQCVATNRNSVPIAYPNDPSRPIIGTNYFEVNGGKISYMRTMHDSLPFRPFTNPEEFPAGQGTAG